MPWDRQECRKSTDLPNRPSPVGTNTLVCPSIIRRAVGKASRRGMPCPKFATVRPASKHTYRTCEKCGLAFRISLARPSYPAKLSGSTGIKGVCRREPGPASEPGGAGKLPSSPVYPGPAGVLPGVARLIALAKIRSTYLAISVGTASTGHDAFKISSLSLAATYPTRHAGNRTTHRILESEHPVPSYFPAQNTRSARGGDCHQFRAFKESTTYGRIRTRNWLTVPDFSRPSLLPRAAKPA